MFYRLKKIIASLIFVSASLFLFADDWYICFGSYDSRDEAEDRIKLLAEKDIPSYVTEFVKFDGSRFYRVFFSSKMDNQKTADILKKSFSTSTETKDIIGDNIWVTSITQAKYVAPSKGNPEKRILIIKDSDTGAPIVDADVNIDDKWKLKTDDQGKAQVPDTITDGDHSLYVTKGNEYVPTTSSFNIKDGEITSAPQISIPKAVDYNRIKIVLDWGEYPLDLDSHIFSDNHHVFYSHKSSGNLNLDRDDTDSYGPETVTIQDPVPEDTYKYYIHNYSDDGYGDSDRLSNSGAQITLFFDNEYKGTFKVKPNQTGLWWHVFDVINKNQIIVVDTVSNTL